MEGAFNAHYGDWLNFGFHYQCDRPVTITWDASACWPFKCASGQYPIQQSPFCLNNYTITLTTAANSYTVTDPSGNTYVWANENLAWPPGWNVALPCLCGGCTTASGSGNAIAANGGVNFVLTPTAVSGPACCVPQLHYRVPGAKSKVNANLAAYCPTNNNAAVCGASWSATPQKKCFSTCATTQGAMATSPGAVAGYTIAGLVVVGVLVLAIYWNFRSGAKSGGHHRTPSNMKDEAVDLNDGRPAAPSGANTNEEVTIQTSS